MKRILLALLGATTCMQANGLDFKGVELDKPASEDSLRSVGIDTSTCHKVDGGTTICKGKTTIAGIPIDPLLVEIAPTGEVRHFAAYFGSVFFEMLEKVAYEKWGGSKSRKEYPVSYNGLQTTGNREDWEFADDSHVTLEKNTTGLTSGVMKIDGPWQYRALKALAPKDKL
jgi:hypothetical protein